MKEELAAQCRDNSRTYDHLINLENDTVHCQYELSQLMQQREDIENRRVDQASSAIDLTHETSSDTDDKVVEIPGFPTDIPRMLVPIEEPPPSEVCILSSYSQFLIID